MEEVKNWCIQEIVFNVQLNEILDILVMNCTLK